MEAKRWHPEGDADEGMYSRVQAGVTGRLHSGKACSPCAVNNSLATCTGAFNAMIHLRQEIPRPFTLHFDITFTI